MEIILSGHDLVDSDVNWDLGRLLYFCIFLPTLCYTNGTTQVVTSEEPHAVGDGLPGCPLRCKRRMISVHSSLQSKLVQNVDPKILISYFEMLNLKGLKRLRDSFIKQNGPSILSKDLIFLDIHPVSEMVNQVRLYCPVFSLFPIIIYLSRMKLDSY